MTKSPVVDFLYMNNDANPAGSNPLEPVRTTTNRRKIRVFPMMGSGLT